MAGLRAPLARLLGVAPGTLGKLRTPLRVPQVLPRPWPDEGAILQAVAPHIDTAPRFLAAAGRRALHSYEPGLPLTELHAKGEAVPDATLRRLVLLLGRVATVPSDVLPALPGDWPRDTDSGAFLRLLVDFAEHEVHQHSRAHFGNLFAALGLPGHPLNRFLDLALTLSRRPFSLLHADVHRDNLVVLRDGRLFLLDWEYALYGDPLHELATHVARMGYPDHQRDELLRMWRKEMDQLGLSARTAGFDQDFPVYLDFERAQSVFPDTIRAALWLRHGDGPDRVAEAAAAIHASLLLARGPLDLDGVPTRREIGAALRDWRREDRHRWMRPRSRP
ncbi:phosphotransferase [Streptomyces sp. NPDC051940]|uniref:phosphotransferase family protein n=1 Tax=Streptomyces sp. NPDC051940 TaxID=3155675 RepID=UPI003416B35B